MLKSLILASLLAAPGLVMAQGKVSNYTTTFLNCSRAGAQAVIVGIRQFNQDGQNLRLVVEANSLQTRLVKSSDLNCVPMEEAQLNATYYGQVRISVAAGKNNLANVGIKRFEQAQVTLTADMCPSSKPYESRFYEWVRSSRQPIGIALTAGWGMRHTAEFNNLKEMSRTIKNITWINHSYRHAYVKGLPDKDNFLLMNGTNMNHEVLDNEIFMIENGLTPSVFFRFPGLISGPQLVDKLLGWGLIPIGSDAWLAKGQLPKAGSIILVHGNGNERPGIDIFFRDLSKITNMGFAALP
jgi:hypothetical protein